MLYNIYVSIISFSLQAAVESAVNAIVSVDVLTGLLKLL